MKILILLPTHAFPADTGQRHRYAHLALYLAKRYKVALAYFTSAPEADETGKYRDAFAEVVRVKEHGSGVSLRQLLSSDPSDVARYRSPEMQAAVHRLTSVFSPDVIITGDPALSQFLESYSGVKVLDYICEATLQFERMRYLSTGVERLRWGLRKAKYTAFLRRIAAVYDLCLVNSIEDREALHAAAPKWQNVELVPNGLDLDAYPFQPVPPVPDTIIYPGSVNYDPNRDAVEWMARDILPRIRLQAPGVRFLVTGRVPANGNAPEAEGLEFTGYLSDVKPAIAGSWVCGVPLRLGAGGTRFKVLEALALGSALVSTAIGYEGVNVTDGENVMMAEDAGTFADRCIAVLKSPDLRQKLSRGGRRLIEDQYNWAILGQRLVDRITGICDTKGKMHARMQL